MQLEVGFVFVCVVALWFGGFVGLWVCWVVGSLVFLFFFFFIGHALGLLAKVCED